MTTHKENCIFHVVTKFEERFTEKDPKTHDDYNVTFGDIGSILTSCKQLQADYFTMEQVEGFAKPYATDNLRTPLEDFQSALMDIDSRSDIATKLYTGFGVLVLEPSPFIKMRRTRTSGIPQIV